MPVELSLAEALEAEDFRVRGKGVGGIKLNTKRQKGREEGWIQFLKRCLDEIKKKNEKNAFWELYEQIFNKNMQ